MNLNNNKIVKSVASLSIEEKKKKAITTYIITGVCCFAFILLDIGFFASILLSLVCSFGYFLFAPTPKIKQKKEKKPKKKSALDEEYLAEFDAEHSE